MQNPLSDTFAVSKEIEFDAGHRVPSHAGKCANPHGHRYRVMLAVEGELQPEGAAEGMVLDFGDIKKVLQEIHDRFDHGFIYSKHDGLMKDLVDRSNNDSRISVQNLWKWVEVDFPPTAEELARWCFIYACERFKYLKLKGNVVGCRVWETPTSSALYPVH